jgi:hypothetical protein
MRKRGGGFGILMLVIVVAIVLYLAAKNLETTVPAARIKDEPAAAAGITLDNSSPNSGESVPARPNLSDMKNATDTHTSDVNRSLDQAQ